MSERILAWDGCLNVRDLGGFTTEDGRTTRFGRVVRADNVRQLSKAGWEAAHAHGVRTVVDLRLARELDAEHIPPESGIGVVHVSVFGEPDEELWSDLERRAAAADGPAEATTLVYLTVLDVYRDRFAEAVAAVADAPPGGVLVHCVGGKDRTGLLVALLLRVAGVPVAEISDDYALSERFLAPRNEQWLAEAADDAERARIRRISATPAEAMRRVLGELEARHGGAEAYLRDGRVDEATVARIRARLLD